MPLRIVRSIEDQCLGCTRRPSEGVRCCSKVGAEWVTSKSMGKQPAPKEGAGVEEIEGGWPLAAEVQTSGLVW